MEGIILKIVQAIWYILPAYLANMSPVFAKKLFSGFSTPVDFGRKFGGSPLFGRNKTYRGLISGTVVGILVALLQQYLYRFNSIQKISLVNYHNINIIGFGIYMGFGALIGDLAKSFIKRRIGIAPGKSWIPFDQTDFLVGAMIMSSLIYVPDLLTILYVLIILPILKVIVDQIGVFLKIHDARL
ncbi:MAG: CDP-archaeol synthase [archaeon]